jgi:hypothetical protein
MRPVTAGGHGTRRDRSGLSDRVGGRPASTAPARPSPAPPAHGRRPDHLLCSCHHAPREGSTNSVVRIMLIMYVRCTSDLGHFCRLLTCDYSSRDAVRWATPQVTVIRVKVPLGHTPTYMRLATAPGPADPTSSRRRPRCRSSSALTMQAPFLMTRAPNADSAPWSRAPAALTTACRCPSSVRMIASRPPHRGTSASCKGLVTR